MEFIFSISFFQIFIIIFILSKSFERNKTHIYSNSIIILNGYNLRYVNLASNSNGDMIFYSTAYPNTTLRAFYGFKNDGRPFFKNENYSYFIFSSKSPQENYESRIFFIEPKNSGGKQYLISVGKANSYVEIYDFDSNGIYDKSISKFYKLDPVLSLRNEAILIDKNTSGHYFLFGFTYKKYEGDNNFNQFCLQIHNLNCELEQFRDLDTSEENKYKFINNPFSELIGISCFKTENNNIICFYLTNDSKFNIIVCDFNLNIQTSWATNQLNIPKDKPFYKCIHLKKEIGVFSFYNNNKPIFLFKKYKINTILNYTISEIILNSINYNFITNITENDIIKLEENKICFSSAGLDKKEIYIILINLFKNDTEYKIRYYSLKIFEIYHIGFYMDLIIHNYNNLIALGFSYNNLSCWDNYDEYYSALIILSYPNSTDKELDLYDYLKNNSNSSINDFIINLEDEVRIENNLFGYNFSRIVLEDIDNCKNPIFISSLNSDAIYSNYILKNNETIKLLFNPNNFYPIFTCTFQYYYNVTEPDLEKYDEYAEIEGYNDENYFSKKKYKGRLSFYKIYLSTNLTSNCSNNSCGICLAHDTSHCVTFKYNIEIETTINEIYSTENSYFYVDIGKNIDLYEEIHIDNITIFKRRLNKSKNEISEIVPNILNTLNKENIYEIDGKDFTMVIKPLSSLSIPIFSNINFSTCEKILREKNTYPLPKIITFVQIEINNTNDKSLINKIEYEAYNENNEKFDLSDCDKNIQISYLLKSNTSLDISSINSFKDLNIDIFNIKDKFFTDICMPYSNNSKDDIVLEDRIIDFFQNYTLCEENCLFEEIDLDLKTIICNCSVKTNISIIEPSAVLEQLEDIENSMAFEIIKCYKLFLSWENKNINIGFWIFVVLIFINIVMIIIYFYKGIKPIKDYIFNEMMKNELIQKNKNSFRKGNKNKKLQKNKSINNTKTKKLKYPPKKKNIKSSSSMFKLYKSERDIIGGINDKKNKKNKKIKNNNDKKNNAIILNKTKKEKYKKN